MNWHVLSIVIIILSIGSESGATLMLHPIGSTNFGDAAISANWCNGCDLIAVGGQNSNWYDGLIEIYRLTPASDTLIPVTSITMHDSTCFSLDWTNDCRFIASDQITTTTTADWCRIQIYQFNETTSVLDPVGTPTQLYNYINSVAWYYDGTYLASQWTDYINSYIQLYHFDPNTGNLTATANTCTLPGGLKSWDVLKWCGNSNYLASAADTTLAVFEFNAGKQELTLTSSVQTNITAYALDTCDNCSYIAIAGWDNESVNAALALYKFDASSTTILSLVASTTFGPYLSSLVNIRWCGCNTLAVGEQLYEQNNNYYYLFYFDQQNLSLIQTIPVNYAPDCSAWCGNCDYFVCGGFGDTGIFQLYTTFGLEAPTALSAQQVSHRFATQIDLANTICWNQVTDAVAYKVYADEALTTLLATITTAPYCYSQHQIMPGIKSTYYVTAIDAYNNESEPTAITI